MTGRLFGPLGSAPGAEGLPGCRLQRLEVLNWGTFDTKVWSLELAGHNALLTGDIGSGKSTFIDALTTLLLPAHRVAYNKAAGGAARERDLRSYVLGYYKSERDEATGASRPVGLRDIRSYSVILGVFANAGYGNTVTVAQVFRAQSQGQPERFYVVADSELSIPKHFCDFGDELAMLRKKLRDFDAKVHDSFPEYGKDFRRRLGIDSEQAMDLFHQTVSMKAVDNLNDFVRNHMLEPFDAKARVASLVDHFDNLTRAHDAVLRARAQLELLGPLVEELDRCDELASAITAAEGQLRALPLWCAAERARLLEAELTRLAAETTKTEAALAAEHVALGQSEAKDRQLGVQIARSGGDRLAAIDEQIASAKRAEPDRRKKFDRFNHLLREAGLDPVSIAEQFQVTQERAELRRAQLDEQEARLQNDLTERRHEHRTLEEEGSAVNEELKSLASRKTNLPRHSLELRAALCADLGIAAETLPFAGELIAVRDDCRDWEGAAERVLRGFALSLVVPDAHYDAVAAWIDGRHLGARLVYYRLPAQLSPRPSGPRQAAHPLMVDMLEINPESTFGPWLAAELERRADHACVESVAAFRTTDKAVTRQGQIKERNRHEKDDRSRIDDRRQYVLGWSNEQKIRALIEHGETLQRRLGECSAAITGLQTKLKTVSGSLNGLMGLREYASWEDLDWRALVKLVADLEAEARRIRSSSDELAALTAEQQQVQAEIEEQKGRLSGLERRKGALENRQATARELLHRAQRTLGDRSTPGALSAELEAVGALMVSRVGAGALDLAALDEVERDSEAFLHHRRDQARDDHGRAESRVVRAMGRFRAAYPGEAAELDDSPASGPGYRQLHQRVAGDDLPRFEREFKEYLNQNTIREIASLSAQLNKQETIIRERVEMINESLFGIDYNPGRYIRLVPDRTPNTEIKEFREELARCTGGIVGADGADQYSEERFLQVKRLVDRFKGREGFADQDATWTKRVTDVRQWFVFSASERWRDDHREHENYTDSAGKSGGQKEKLAYTILAASLAYQFKLDFHAERSKAFRFVAIDEAFGRGSDDSTRYALSLFTSLGLQLLIVTPLQKIHVIEPHVQAVGFVDNLDGNYSRLQCLTIEEYHRRRQQGAGEQRPHANET